MDRKRANYISLKDASALCTYSPDYLNLIARKGYLKAVKIGRNWVTKKEWLKDYLSRVERKHGRVLLVPKPQVFASQEGNGEGGWPQGPVSSGVVATTVVAEKLGLFMVQPPRPARDGRVRNFVSFASLALVALLVFATIFFSQRDIFATGIKISFATVAHHNGVPVLHKIFSSRVISASLDGAAQGSKSFFAGVIDFFKGAGSKLEEFANYVFLGRTEIVEVSETKIQVPAGTIDKTVLEKSTDQLEENIINDTKVRIDDFRDEFGLPKVTNGTEPSQGMVVVPSTGNESGDKKLKDQIKNNFSDEVTVETLDENSGILVPQFRDGPGGEYIYMLVPVNDQ